MSVLIETSVGELVIDLLVEDCPQTCLNFLKLCKIKYYNFSSFWNVQKDFMVQTGDPTATGKGGESVFGIINGPSRRYFPAEVKPYLKHRQKGTVSMAASGDATGTSGVNGSQFFITTADGLDYLDGKYTVFGNVAEGWDTLDKINEAYCDETGRPLKDIRIRHTIILDDPYPDPKGLVIPDRSPVPTKEMMNTIRIADDEEIEDDRPSDVVEREVRDQEAQAQALTLEMVGDLPFAEIKPPENVLFVCKLNPVTRDEDLELIFSRFGTISNCEVIRDKKTGDSLSYAFIEFDEREACEEAYFKMQNCLIDERRIKVDFSQSVSKLHANWVTGRQGAGYAGSSNLVKKSKYRGQPDKVNRDEYDMVFESTGTPTSDKQTSNKDDDDRKSGRRETDDRSRDGRRAPVGGDRDGERRGSHGGASNKDDDDRRGGRRDGDDRSRDVRRAPVGGDRDGERRESQGGGYRDRGSNDHRDRRSNDYRDRGSNDYHDRDHRHRERERGSGGSRRSRSRSPIGKSSREQRDSERRNYKHGRGGH